jgi:O-antigen/teichoic acid export membrane protein
MPGVRRALLLSTGDRYAALLINFITVAVVSRILSPAEVGVSVVGMAIVAIAMSAREFASGNFLIQGGDLARDDVRAAFTVMVCLNAAIAAALAAAAPTVAFAYGEERLITYLRVVAGSLLLEVLAAPLITLLRREMAFGKVVAINVSGAVCAAVVTIALAQLGFSYMSFAWAWLASAVVTGMLAVALVGQAWMFRPRFRGWSGMLAFGGYNGATVLLYKAYEAVPYLLLGRLLSMHAAALFSRGLMVCQLPDKVFLGGAMSVVLPAFAATARGGRDLAEPYLKALALITALQWPALLMVAILAHPIVDVLLGAQWHEVAPLVQVIAIACLFTFSFELNYPVLVSMGALRDAFLRALIVCPISAATVVGAAFVGLQAVALSLLVVIPFQALVSLIFVRRHVRVAWVDIGAALWRSAALACITAAPPLILVLAAGSGFEFGLGIALAACALAALAWPCGLLITGHPLLDEVHRALLGLKRPSLVRVGLGSA